MTCKLKLLAVFTTAKIFINFMLCKFRRYVKNLRVLSTRTEIKYLSLQAVEREKECYGKLRATPG